jgi:putative oxidoreductase
MTAMRARPLYDIFALLARIGIGTVFIAHGWQKVQVGITTTSEQFTVWDVPFPMAAAVYATFVELLGGAALILGLALPVAGVLLFLDMAIAAVFINGTNGIFLVDEQGAARNGFELALVLGLAGLLFAVGGAGRITLDNRLFGRRTTAPAGQVSGPVSERTSKRAAAESTAAPTAAPGAESGAESTAAPGSPDAPAGGHEQQRASGSRSESTTSTARSTSRSPSSSTASPAETATTRSGAPSKQAKPAKPAMPATTGGPTVAESAASPRLAADIVTGTSGDTLVAGRKKRRSGGKKEQRDATQPTPKGRGTGKSDPAD